MGNTYKVLPSAVAITIQHFIGKNFQKEADNKYKKPLQRNVAGALNSICNITTLL